MTSPERLGLAEWWPDFLWVDEEALKERSWPCWWYDWRGGEGL